LGALDEVSLTGGEPFIKKDFVEIYGFFRQRYPRATLVITTNGFNTPLIARKLGEILARGGAPPILVFSLDGGPELHQQVRGVGDGFAKVRRSIEAARSLHTGLRIVLSYTILPFNYRDLEAVYGLSVDLDASFTMRFGTKSDIYYGNADWACTWARSQVDEVHGIVGRIVKDMLGRRNLLMRALNPDTYFYSRMTDYQRHPRRIFECFSGTHSFFMDPWGNVFPCITLPHALGNVRGTPFDQFWFSEEAREARAAIARWECHCWTECEAIPSLQRTLRRRAVDRGGGAPVSVRTAADG
ncbi:MAG: radical SAM protein, partial [Acidobacteriota bacterium]